MNCRFSTGSWCPIVLVERHEEPLQVFRLLRAADVCYVGSLHDGMNLVAEEFVAARDDQDGVLVLSGFTGAAQELADGACIINPYDVDQSANALAEALSMERAARQQRMRTMRRVVKAWDARRWATALISDAARQSRAFASLPSLAPAADEMLPRAFEV